MADMKDFDDPRLTSNAKNHSVDVRLVAVQQMPETLVLWCGGIAIGQFSKAEDRCSQA